MISLGRVFEFKVHRGGLRNNVGGEGFLILGRCLVGIIIQIRLLLADSSLSFNATPHGSAGRLCSREIVAAGHWRPVTLPQILRENKRKISTRGPNCKVT